MHHDHAVGELRVSQNEKITQSLLDLVSRNKNIYSPDDALYMNFIVNLKKNETTIRDGLYWSYKKRNPKHFVKCILGTFKPN